VAILGTTLRAILRQQGTLEVRFPAPTDAAPVGDLS
jgi:hypothetical protein